jgi:hypothetical protein
MAVKCNVEAQPGYGVKVIGLDPIRSTQAIQGAVDI